MSSLKTVIQMEVDSITASMTASSLVSAKTHSFGW